MAFMHHAWKARDSFGNAAEQTKDWIVKHPGQMAGIVGCVAAAPVTITLTPLALGAAGFTAGGVVAGSAAAGAQAAIGNVAAGSAFAILQSAGAGGAGLAVINVIVGGAATVVVVGATAPGLVKAATEGNESGAQEEQEKTMDKGEPVDGEPDQDKGT